MDKTWTKYTFVCDPEECDTMIEVTCDNYGFPSGVMQITCPCGRKLDILSVQDATINTPTKEREQMLDNLEASIDFEAPSIESTYNPNLVVTYKKIHGYSDPEFATDKIVNLEWELHNGRQASKTVGMLESNINGVREYIQDAYADSSDKESLTEIASLLNIELTKTVTIRATIDVDIEVELELEEANDFDAHYFLQDELCIDSNNGNVSVDSWTVTNTDVDWN
jgi:hypothetical protein